MNHMSHARTVIPILLALTLVLPFSALSLEAAPAATAMDVVPDQYIVTFTDNVADPGAKARGLAARHGLSVFHVYQHALKGFAARVPAARLAHLHADPDIASITPDRVVSIQAQTVPTGISRIGGEPGVTVASDGSGSVDVDVAVLDTGIDIDHPDLNVVGGRSCSTGKSYDDGNGHGTHVAGTIGARDDGNGVVGVAPGVRLWAVRVLDNSGSGTWSGVICGVDWVTGKKDLDGKLTIEVANMSLGGDGSAPSASGCRTGTKLHDAICKSVQAGVTYVAAAGNNSANASTFVPAAYDEVIAVSALADFDGLSGGLGKPTCRFDADDTLADFSNYGAAVDIIAPGVCIKSTWLNGGYNTMSGTSMASPHVAGAAALYKAKYPGANPQQVKDALLGAGTYDWTGDKDSLQERLLNVAGLSNVSPQ